MSFNYASLLGISNSTVDNLYVDNLNLTADYFTANGWTYKLPPKNDFIVLENAVQPVTNKTIDASVIGSITPSTGKFISVDTDELIIPDKKINGSKIVDTSINSDKIVSLTCNKLSGDYITLMNTGHYIKGLKIGDLEVADTLSFPVNTLDGSFIKDNTITNNKIVSLDSSKLTGTITLSNSGHYIGGLKVDNLNITNTISLPAYSVDGAAIALNSITDNKIVSLDGSKISDGTITGPKIMNNAITYSKISSVLGSAITANSIASTKLISVDGIKLIDNTVSSNKIVSLDANKLSGLITLSTSGHYIGGLKTDDLNVTTSISLPNNSINDANIVSLDASKLTGNFNDIVLNASKSIRCDYGRITKGHTATGTGTDLGMYSSESGKYIRMVTNGANIRFYSDASTSNNYGGNYNVSIESNGSLILNGAYPNLKLNGNNRLVIGGGSAFPANDTDSSHLVLNSPSTITNSIITLNRIDKGSVFLGCNQEATNYNGTGGVLGTNGGSFRIKFNMNYDSDNILASGTDGLVLMKSGKLSSKNNTLDDNGSMTVTNGLTVSSGSVTLPNNSVSGNAIASIDASKVTGNIPASQITGNFGNILTNNITLSGRVKKSFKRCFVGTAEAYVVRSSGATGSYGINYGDAEIICFDGSSSELPTSVTFYFPPSAVDGEQITLINRLRTTAGATRNISLPEGYYFGFQRESAPIYSIVYSKIQTFMCVSSVWYGISHYP